MKNNCLEIMSGEEVLRESLTSAPDGRPLARRVFFGADSWEVAQEFKALINAHANYLKDNPDRIALVSGHTLGLGGARYCWLIGERRSRAVMRALVAAGVKAQQIVGVSKGVAKPEQAPDPRTARYQRRVNIEYYAAKEVDDKLVPPPGAPAWWKAVLGRERPALLKATGAGRGAARGCTLIKAEAACAM